MTSPTILLALHAPGAGATLAEGLPARGLPVLVSRNMAETWNAARARAPDAIVLAPLSQDTASAEFKSLMDLAAATGGPALLVLTAAPDSLAPRWQAFDDFLPADVDAETAARRLRFVLDRRAALAGLRTERERLLQAATTDYKTGLCNDRGFAERSREEVSRARRQDAPIAVLMIDFDGFKAINDVHGHDFGDRALAAFAHALRGNLRDFDVAARLGGDEFAVLLPGSLLPDAIRIAERVRGAVGTLAVEHEGRRAALSVSIGVAGWSPDGKEALEAATRGADRALLQAKSLGGGRICLFEDGVVSAVAAATPTRATTPADGPTIETPARTRGRRRAQGG